IRIMSESLIPFQPPIEEPSNILPSTKKLSFTTCEGKVTCCSLPLKSVKRKSIQRASCSLIRSKVLDIECLQVVIAQRLRIVKVVFAIGKQPKRAACLKIFPTSSGLATHFGERARLGCQKRGKIYAI